MIKKLLFGACLVGGAMMSSSCAGSGKNTESKAEVEIQEEPTVEYIRLNCIYNVDDEHSVEAIELARQLIASSLNDAGVIDYDMYQSATRPGRFIIYETWKDQASLDDHSASEHFTKLVPQIQAIAPLDVQRFEKIADAPTEGKQIRINCMYTAKEGEEDSLLATAKELVAATQSDEGMIEYDIYTSVTRPNHFMIFETWTDQPSLDAHAAAPHFATYVPQMRDFIAESSADFFYY